MEVVILNAQSSKSYGVAKLPLNITVGDAPAHIFKQLKKTPTPNRQSLRLEPRGKALKTTDKLELNKGDNLYIKDLGPQIGWKTVFLAEYAGPLVVYLSFYVAPLRPMFYGANASLPLSLTTNIAAGCYTVHYIKRLLETIFVHRFSHATMPIANLFKNCSYYWGFTAYVSYHVNHPLYTSTCMCTVWLALAGFAVCELGNFSTHIAFRNLRPPGSKVRKIPMPDGNPFCYLFNFVSCPNYTYEIGAWFCYSIMTSCLPAYFFTAAGAYQMTVWALGKHRNYKKEFGNYPKQRCAIFPFIL